MIGDDDDDDDTRYCIDAPDLLEVVSSGSFPTPQALVCCVLILGEAGIHDGFHIVVGCVVIGSGRIDEIRPHCTNANVLYALKRIGAGMDYGVAKAIMVLF